MKQFTLTLCLLVCPLLLAGTNLQAQSNSLGNGVVAQVNNKPISQLALDTVLAQQKNAGTEVKAEDVLSELINLELLTQEAEKQSLDQDPAIATSLQLQYSQTMANALLAKMSEDIRVTDEDVRAEYSRQTANLTSSEYKASHILVDDEALAKELINQLANGADFAELAKTHSTGPTGVSGGDLGWFQGNAMVPEFTAGVEPLEKGSVTQDPVKTQFGWHVIKLDDKRNAALPDFDSVKEGLRNVLVREQLNEQIAQIRASADIKQ